MPERIEIRMNPKHVDSGPHRPSTEWLIVIKNEHHDPKYLEAFQNVLHEHGCMFTYIEMDPFDPKIPVILGDLLQRHKDVKL